MPIPILLDTNIFISHDRGKSDLYEQLLELKLDKETPLFISSLTIFEYYLGIKFTKKRLIQAKRKFEPFEIINPTNEICIKAARLMQKYQIGEFDSILAATCLQHRFKLATLNTKHFKMIKNLKLSESQII